MKQKERDVLSREKQVAQRELQVQEATKQLAALRSYTLELEDKVNTLKQENSVLKSRLLLKQENEQCYSDQIPTAPTQKNGSSHTTQQCNSNACPSTCPHALTGNQVLQMVETILSHTHPLHKPSTHEESHTHLKNERDQRRWRSPRRHQTRYHRRSPSPRYQRRSPSPIRPPRKFYRRVPSPSRYRNRSPSPRQARCRPHSPLQWRVRRPEESNGEKLKQKKDDSNQKKLVKEVGDTPEEVQKIVQKEVVPERTHKKPTSACCQTRSN